MTNITESTSSLKFLMLEEVNNLLSLIKTSNVSEKEGLISLASCLKSIDESLFNSWTIYAAGIIEHSDRLTLWQNTDPMDNALATLHYWARYCNKNGYEKLKTDKISTLIKSITQYTINDITKLLIIDFAQKFNVHLS